MALRKCDDPIRQAVFLQRGVRQYDGGKPDQLQQLLHAVGVVVVIVGEDQQIRSRPAPAGEVFAAQIPGVLPGGAAAVHHGGIAAVSQRQALALAHVQRGDGQRPGGDDRRQNENGAEPQDSGAGGERKRPPVMPEQSKQQKQQIPVYKPDDHSPVRGVQGGKAQTGKAGHHQTDIPAQQGGDPGCRPGDTGQHEAEHAAYGAQHEGTGHSGKDQQVCRR